MAVEDEKLKKEDVKEKQNERREKPKRDEERESAKQRKEDKKRDPCPTTYKKNSS